MRKFQKGDKVSVLDDTISGLVVAVNSQITIETIEGFTMNFDASELVLENDNKLIRMQSNPDLSTLQSKIEKPKKKLPVRKSKERNAPAMEVDLHIHQLVPNERGMSSYDMLSLQLETAKRRLEFAIQKKIQKIVFIHGVGEGVLRAELEYMFNRYENLKFYDADYQKYGQGAIEVYIYQNKTP